MNVATPPQIAKILEWTEQGLKEGGIGIGVPWGYAPGAGMKELLAVWQLAAKYGRPTYTHIQHLSMVDPFFVQNGALYLELPYDSGTMRFGSPADTVELLGTIVKKDIEGGFFAVESDDGRVYDPINLPEYYKKDGLKVKVNAKLRNDVGSIHMVGEIIEIIDIVEQ